jgi:Tfp pilus assembly protein PilF
VAPWLTLVMVACMLSVRGQQSVRQLRATALSYQMQGDYANTLLVLGTALQMEPKNMELLTDLAHTYYLQGQYGVASEAVRPLLDREDADERTFQVGGNIFKALGDVTSCEKMYKKAIKKFPESGVLLCEYGEILLSMKEPAKAFALWERGILSDPSHSGNYYHAAKYHYFRGEKVWSIVLAETFLNLESYSARSAEIKEQLLDSYKRFFIPEAVSAQTEPRKPSAFEQAFRSTLMRQAPLASRGIDVNRLIMIRTRFILDWFQGPARQFPHAMLEQQRQMLRDGYYEAYNLWLFGAASNMTEYKNWANTHEQELAAFNQFWRKRVFRVPTGQYYLGN